MSQLPTMTIHGYTFNGILRYEAGHVLSEHEALALNRTLNDTVRNNMKSTVAKVIEDAKLMGKEKLSDEDMEKLQQAVTEYAERYDFTLVRKPRIVVDPVLREARKMIKPHVIAYLHKKNIDVKTIDEDQLRAFLDQALAKRPEVKEEARRRIEAMREMASKVLPEDEDDDE